MSVPTAGGCVCTIDHRSGVVVDREDGCPRHGSLLVAIVRAAWERTGQEWPDDRELRRAVLEAVDAGRAPLLVELDRWPV